MRTLAKDVIRNRLIVRKQECDKEISNVELLLCEEKISRALYNKRIDELTHQYAEILADAKAVGYNFNTSEWEENLG